ncbi:MAG TPA: DUF2793 domain-containing protein, partial [Rhizobiaceae bacterium]|nr:DUF2793 domain-containing protein [Rhizobiaceae bacterium]
MTVNAALLTLDALAQPVVLDRDLTGPPAQPVDGDCYIPAAPATGDWVGREGRFAVSFNGAWQFHAPKPGWRAWIADEEREGHFDGTNWVEAPGSGAVATLSVNGALADSTNRIAANAPASLFNHDGAGHQVKINKAAAGETASLLFQDGFSGRAEIGIVGNDDLAVKVSGIGAHFVEALRVNRHSGRVAMPGGRFHTPDIIRQRRVSTSPWLSSATPADIGWRSVCWSAEL